MLWHARIKMEHNLERGPQGDGVLGGVVGAGDAGVAWLLMLGVLLVILV